MKTKHLLLLAALLFVPLATPALAREVVVSWDANAPAEKVTHYTLYLQKGAAWEILKEAPGTEATVNLPDGMSVIAVAAVNAQGFRGPMSEPLEVLALPSAPAGLKMRITIELETTDR